MEAVPKKVLRKLEAAFDSNYSDDLAIRRKLSGDFSWLSPILSKELGDCVADAVVWPRTTSELVNLIEVAKEDKVPLTPRGGGTSNYGQVVPIRGGVVVDTTKMNKILKVSEDELYVDVEPGANMKVLMDALKDRGLSLKMYPSTYTSCTIGGFYSGGSRGFGSTKFGTIFDDNLTSADVLSADGVEKSYSGRGLDGIIHAYGTTGMITRLRVPIIRQKEEDGFVVSVPSLRDALSLSGQLVNASSGIKLLSILEPSIGGRYNAILKENLFDDKRWNMTIIFESSETPTIEKILSRYDVLKLEEAAEKLKDHIVEYSFNHVALWGKRSNPSLTNVYMHFYDLDKVEAKIHDIKRKFGDDVFFHLEFTKQSGKMIVTSLSLLNYKNFDFYQKFTAYVKSRGVHIMNIHSYKLNDQIGHLTPERVVAIQKLKTENDPYNIFNPGKIVM